MSDQPWLKCEWSVMTAMWVISHDWNVIDQSWLKCEWSAMTDMWVISHDWYVSDRSWLKCECRWLMDQSSWLVSVLLYICLYVCLSVYIFLPSVLQLAIFWPQFCGYHNQIWTKYSLTFKKKTIRSNKIMICVYCYQTNHNILEQVKNSVYHY